MKNILITGGAGFIGSSLAKKLFAEGYQLVILDNLSKQIHGESPEQTSPTYQSIKGLGKFILADVRDREALRLSLEGIDCVIHLAAETGTGQSMYDISNYCEVNIQATAILLEEVMKRKNQIKKIIVASSRAIYGEGQYECKSHGKKFPAYRDDNLLKQKKFNHQCDQCQTELQLVPTEETAPGRPLSIYGITKLSQEELVLKAAQSMNIEAVALRFQNVYGPGQSLSNPYTGILSIFSNRARKNLPISIFEDGLESRDFVYIDDVVQSLYLAVKTSFANLPQKQQAFNIGSAVSTSVNQVVQSIIHFFNSKSEVKVTGEYRLGDIRHNFANLKKSEEILKYKPTVYFEEGLKNFLTWTLSQELGPDAYEKSLEELRTRGLLK